MFDIGKWLYAVIHTSATYGELRRYAMNGASVEVHCRSYSEVALDASGEIVEREPGERLTKTLRDDLEAALEHFTSLMVVTAGTYFECMVSEFLFSAFIAKPESMHAFLVGDDAKVPKGYIRLREVLEAADIEEIKRRLATRACRVAANGPANKVCDRIADISKYKIPGVIVSEVQDILDRRNRIVHEAARYSVGEIDVEAVFSTLYNVVRELGLACRHAGFPYLDLPGVVDEQSH